MKNRVFYILLFALSLIATSAVAQHKSTSPLAKHAVIDLRQNDFGHKTYNLDGEWAFFWKQLISPDSIGFYKPAYLPFPMLWNKLHEDMPQVSAYGYATYAADVLLPHQKTDLALKIPDVYTSYRIYVNGQLFGGDGQVGKNDGEYKPHWSNNVKQLPQDADTLHIVLQVANFRHYKGGTYKSLVIGNAALLTSQQTKSLSVDFLLTGCLFMGGLFFFGLYLFGKHDKAILYFSLFSMMYSYRIAGADPYALHSFLPGIPWEVTVHIEYLSLYLSCIFFMKYTRHLYPDDTNKTVITLMVWGGIFFMLVTIFFPAVIFTQFLNSFLIVVFLYIAYALYVYIKAARHRRTGAKASLAGVVVMLAVFITINLHYFGVLGSFTYIVFTGYFCYFFLQSLILSFRFAHSLKAARAQAEQALKTKSEFLSIMSHEIRTPLNGVIGMAHALMKKRPGENQKKELDVMLFSAKNLLSIVNDILDFNKIEAGKIQFDPAPSNLDEIAENIVRSFSSFAAEKGIELRLQTDPSLNVLVMLDPTRLSQVLTNLVHNAIKFTEKGSVQLVTEVKERSAEYITVTIRVVDTGIGITYDKQQKIFDQFTQADTTTTRSFGGTGLGLSISKSLLEMQGCRLLVNSHPGKGSAFYFTQTFKIAGPVITGSNGSKTKKPVNETPLMGYHLLMAEDNEFNVMVALNFLENWGATVDVAENGRQAIEKFDPKNHKLILMDLHMPEIDGYQATRRLRKDGYNVPIIALTASSQPDDDYKIRDCGANDVVIKPFEPEDLLTAILRHV